MDGQTTTYSLDLNAGLTQVLADGANTYLYGNDRIAQENIGTDYYLGDALGSVRQMTDGSGDDHADRLRVHRAILATRVASTPDGGLRPPRAAGPGRAGECIFAGVDGLQNYEARFWDIVSLLNALNSGYIYAGEDNILEGK